MYPVAYYAIVSCVWYILIPTYYLELVPLFHTHRGLAELNYLLLRYKATLFIEKLLNEGKVNGIYQFSQKHIYDITRVKIAKCYLVLVFSCDEQLKE